MNVNLKVDTGRLTLGDLIKIEEEVYTARFIRDILSRFLVDPETGDYYADQDQAERIADKISANEAEIAVKSFGAKVMELQANAVPPDQSGN